MSDTKDMSTPNTESSPAVSALPTLDVQNIDNIDSVEQIEGMQKELSSNYKTLAREFSKSRIARVDAYITKIEEMQQKLRRNLMTHEAHVEQGMPMMDEETGAQLSSLGQMKQNKRRKFSSVDTGFQSPPPEAPQSPILDPLELFTEPFEQLLEPYRKNLDALKRKYELSSDLIETMCYKNRSIVWKQSIRDRQETREHLRRDTISKLWDLEKDYMNVSQHEKMRVNEQRYRASVRKVGEKRAKSDMTLIADGVKERAGHIASTAAHDAATLYQKGTPLTSASEEEIDRDINIIRNGIPSSVRVETIESGYLFKDPAPKKPSVVATTMTDLVNSEIEANGIAAIQFQVPDRYPMQMQNQTPQYPPQPPPQQMQQGPFQYPPYGQQSPPYYGQAPSMGQFQPMQGMHPPPPPPPAAPPSQQQHQQQLPPSGSFKKP
ncbi:CYFA0S11e00518g1_1 [Cyberlindnera fabianii]|uniref:CYFA0S11e00518g1_1 n=1 Tax=Cyberlindnera fabianii TaxID=36022 RepID=A0A061AZP8_CYBFA|nr:CYFA0S11e00518g1_1 [Cyberlindnera fabianii]